MANTRLPPFKAGDTFTLYCRHKVDGEYETVAGKTIRAQLRTASGDLVANLTTVVADQSSQFGGFSLLASNTSGWPVGVSFCDIEIEEGGVIRSSETFTVMIVRGVTR